MSRRLLLPFFALLMAVAFTFFPDGVNAQSAGLSAGFPEAPLWLSETDVTEGDAVKIYSVVYNASATSVTGTIAFTVDSASVSSTSFTLPSGATQIESASWTAVEGTHKFQAEIESTASTSALTNQKTATVSITVAKAPPPPAAVQALNTAVGAANTAAVTATPIIANAVSTIANTTEGIRTAGADYLGGLIGNSVTASAATGIQSGKVASDTPKGEVLGAQTYNASAVAAAHQGFWGGIMLSIERFFFAIFDNAWLFYPFFAILLFVLLYFLLRRFGRKRA